ncbi:5-oxoprolinase subunit PxpB [Rhodocyclaceae bacterium SMB388]
MSDRRNHRILDLGDAAFTIEFGDTIDPVLQRRVRALDLAIDTVRQHGDLEGIVEAVPTFRSLTVIYDPLVTSRTKLTARIAHILDDADEAVTADPCHWRLPACYEGDAAPDLDDVARRIDADTATVVQLHAGTEYVVYMLGFLPGFPFMGDLPERLRLPRRHEPRVRVPAGSVAIATGLTAIYPWESPGGWHLLGRCPVRLFDPTRTDPALLQPGDRVSFLPVGRDEYDALARELESGRIDPHRWCDVGAASIGQAQA